MENKSKDEYIKELTKRVAELKRLALKQHEEIESLKRELEKR